MDSEISKEAEELLHSKTDPETLHLLAEFGPLMTYKDLSKALKYSSGTIKNLLSDKENDLAWVVKLREAKHPAFVGAAKFKTVLVADLLRTGC